jgi:hypothetical protein
MSNKPPAWWVHMHVIQLGYCDGIGQMAYSRFYLLHNQALVTLSQIFRPTSGLVEDVI